jgi:hypothetical protein
LAQLAEEDVPDHIKGRHFRRLKARFENHIVGS